MHKVSAAEAKGKSVTGRQRKKILQDIEVWKRSRAIIYQHISLS